MKLKDGLMKSSSDFWYDLTDGGYLKPEEMCADPADAKKVIDAIAVIRDFQKSCEEQIDDFVE